MNIYIGHTEIKYRGQLTRILLEGKKRYYWYLLPSIVVSRSINNSFLFTGLQCTVIRFNWLIFLFSIRITPINDAFEWAVRMERMGRRSVKKDESKTTQS